jgi:hypothetical protein
MPSANGKEVSPELLKLQDELIKKFVTIQAARMRAYASVGTPAGSPQATESESPGAGSSIEGAAKSQ